MADSKIEWCDKVWNPVTGCSPVSPGCQNCYASRMAKRLRGRFGYPKERPFTVMERFHRVDEPYRWLKPRRIFVCSMGDLFHKDVSEKFILNVLVTAASIHWHTFQFLTKRPSRMLDVFRKLHASGRLGPAKTNHFWLGASIEDQERADERIGYVLRCPAAVRIVSIEPMLGPVELQEPDPIGRSRNFLGCQCGGNVCSTATALGWVICGAETGPGARPMELDWARAVRDQCKAADVPFFFKSAGPGIETPPDLQIRQFPEACHA